MNYFLNMRLWSISIHSSKLSNPPGSRAPTRAAGLPACQSGSEGRQRGSHLRWLPGTPSGPRPWPDHEPPGPPDLMEGCTMSGHGDTDRLTVWTCTPASGSPICTPVAPSNSACSTKASKRTSPTPLSTCILGRKGECGHVMTSELTPDFNTRALPATVRLARRANARQGPVKKENNFTMERVGHD